MLHFLQRTHEYNGRPRWDRANAQISRTINDHNPHCKTQGHLQHWDRLAHPCPVKLAIPTEETLGGIPLLVKVSSTFVILFASWSGVLL